MEDQNKSDNKTFIDWSKLKRRASECENEDQIIGHVLGNIPLVKKKKIDEYTLPSNQPEDKK